MLNNRSLTVQFAVVFLLALTLVGAAFYLILDRIYVNQLKSQAETVADNVDAFGSWVAQYGRVWVKDDDKSFLGPREPVPAGGSRGGRRRQAQPGRVLLEESGARAARILRSRRALAVAVEVPADLAQRDESEQPAGRVRGRRTAPDPRQQAQGILRAHAGGFRYARAVYQKASCIACHGDAAKAPEDVKVRYGTTNGFGFKEGDVAGIISVRLPARSFWDIALNVVGVWELVMIIAAFVIAMLFMYYAVVAPVRRLTAATQQISLGKAGRPRAGAGGAAKRKRIAPARARDRAPARQHQHGDTAAHREEALRLKSTQTSVWHMHEGDHHEQGQGRRVQRPQRKVR